MSEYQRYHQKFVLNANTWTHLHIGCGRDIGRWEYFFSADGRQLSFLDYDKLAKEALTNEKFIDQLTEAAAQDPSGSLQKFLRVFEPNDSNLPSRLCTAGGMRTLPSAAGDVPAEFRTIRRLRLFIGSPNCYIPGSSIKGALRSAYLAEQIAASNYQSDFLPREANADDFTNLRALRERLQKTFRANADDTRLFENLIVRDSQALESSKLGVASISLFGSRKRPSQSADGKSKPVKDSDEYAEVVLARAQFKLEIVLRTCRKYALPLTDLRELLEIADRFYRKVWAAELEHQEILAADNKGVRDLFEFYRNEQMKVPGDYYLLRVGYGGGQMAHSILLPYRQFYEKQYAQAADHPLRHSLLYSRRRPELKQRSPYPFSARSALAGDVSSWIPLGWIAISKKLEEQNEIEKSLPPHSSPDGGLN